MTVFSVAVLALQATLLFSSSTQADKTIHVQRNVVPFEHSEGTHQYSANGFIDAKTFYPGLKDYMDNWFQVVREINTGARNPPNSKFWTAFYTTENYVPLDVTYARNHYLRQSADEGKYRLTCNIEIEIKADPGVQVGIETMKLHSDGKELFQMLAQYPKIIKTGGHGKLHEYNSKIVNCRPGTPPPTPDQSIVLKRRTSGFTHVSVWGGKVEFGFSNVVQPIDLFKNFNPANRNLINVALAFNAGARRGITKHEWDMFLSGQPTAIAVTENTYHRITADANQFMYLCTFEMHVPPLSAYEYHIETMEVLTKGISYMNVVDQHPHVTYKDFDGHVQKAEAAVLYCNTMATQSTQSQNLKRADNVNVMASCGKNEACAKQALDVENKFQAKESQGMTTIQSSILIKN